MTDVCNYSCSYCPESLRNGKEYKIDISAIDNFLSQLMYQNKNRKVFFHLGGGEPTILKNFEELLQLFKTYRINVSIQTNGSRPLSWWQKNIHYFSKVHLSYHSLECSNEEFFLKKLNTVRTLYRPT